eukprot:1195626-Prorocentrum_minimum.AAC.5
MAEVAEMAEVARRSDGPQALMRQDMANMAIALRWLRWVGVEFDFAPLVNELRTEGLKELDFTTEAANLDTCRANLFKGGCQVVTRQLPGSCQAVRLGFLILLHASGQSYPTAVRPEAPAAQAGVGALTRWCALVPGLNASDCNTVRVPRVVHEVSTSRLLVMEFVAGGRFTEECAKVAPLERVRLVTEVPPPNAVGSCPGYMPLARTQLDRALIICLPRVFVCESAR